ncbi:CRIB domain-containing protein RIC7 [Manihot esculenta]|uniref:CRIB domain-containing protein n=2 Tax=Manihot esculenta TaxID=3983 RepID=A0A2C9UNU2_MANES|nr:CRIB domain-containing protein RIC7 [Manihot esculenta]OAY32669.1 hypothetical protein MANES_13G036400v8 [Manihot esculenta]
MANNQNNKMKGVLKGLRYISQIFDTEKEPEMQIGLPTDVKHVAHIGFDGPAVNSPSWMTEFKAPPGISSGSNGDPNDVKWVSDDSASRKNSMVASESSSRDLPELPKSSRRHSSMGGVGDSPPKEKSDKPKQSRRSSRNANKESGEVKSTRQKNSGPQKNSGQLADGESNADAPKKSRRKKSKESTASGSISKSSRSKAQASDGDCGSESVSKSLNIDNREEDAENGFTGIS